MNTVLKSQIIEIWRKEETFPKDIRTKNANFANSITMKTNQNPTKLKIALIKNNDIITKLKI